MAETRYCWCGYPIVVEDEPSVDGERQVYSQLFTGEVIEECPGCGDSPLDVSRLFSEPPPSGVQNDTLEGGIP